MLLVAAYVDYSCNTPASDADTFPASQGCELICANFDYWLVPSHLLSLVGGHRMVVAMGDYNSILAKRTMGRIEGTGRDVISPFSSFPSPPPPPGISSTCIPRKYLIRRQETTRDDRVSFDCTFTLGSPWATSLVRITSTGCATVLARHPAIPPQTKWVTVFKRTNMEILQY